MPRLMRSTAAVVPVQLICWRLGGGQLGTPPAHRRGNGTWAAGGSGTAFISLDFGRRKSVKRAQWRGTTLKTGQNRSPVQRVAHQAPCAMTHDPQTARRRG